MREAAVLVLVLALALGRDVLTALRGSNGGAAPAKVAERQPLDVDRGLSVGGKVHISFCTS